MPTKESHKPSGPVNGPEIATLFPSTGGRPGESPTPPPAPPAAPDPTDPFDPDRLRLSQDFAGLAGCKRKLVTVPVRKPAREWFVRTHPDPTYRLPVAVLELKEDRELYLVAPELREALVAEATFGPRLLVTSVTRQGVVFLWPIRVPGPDGRIDDWSRSAMDGADTAKDEWTRISANMTAGAYDVMTAPNVAFQPDWPDLPFKEILRVAFRDRYISEWDHPALRRLRGEL